jgi:hypothetical protein
VPLRRGPRRKVSCPRLLDSADQRGADVHVGHDLGALLQTIYNYDAGGPRWQNPLTRRFHQAGTVAWSVSSRGGGGCTYDGAQSAATSDAATTRPASTRPRTRRRRTTRSSAASSRARIGFGAIGRTNTFKGRASLPRTTILSTNQSPDRLDGSQPIGETSWSAGDDPVVRSVVTTAGTEGLRQSPSRLGARACGCRQLRPPSSAGYGFPFCMNLWVPRTASAQFRRPCGTRG